MTVVEHNVVVTPSASGRRLLVTVRPVDQSAGPRPYRAIGFLSCLRDGYEFSYLSSAVSQPGFAPLVGFADTSRAYRSDHLFPQFAQRVMSAHRPDRPSFLEAIDLSVDSEPWEILSRSGGRRGGDTVELMEEPMVSPDGRTSSTFLVHGVRHQGVNATERIAQLHRGELLLLASEPDNPVNDQAVLVTADDSQPLGHVPDPLVEYVNAVMKSEHEVRVVRANGSRVSPHLRLLVRLEGRVRPGYIPFDRA